jgi:hypothetical protein
MKFKKALLNSALVVLATCLALVLCELGARLVLNPADYLNVEMVEDPVLGRRLAPGSAGFDAWGFRNGKVPATAEVVAIGDSHTYGNCAQMQESWPHVLGRLTGQAVYNLGLGGYGPNQYYHLFRTKALGLKPRTIICGLYMGDDFENAFLITYGLDHWAYLRELPADKVDFDIWEAPESPTWHRRIRIWLSRHSVIYKLLFHGPLAGGFKRRMQIQNAERLYPAATSLVIEEKNICEAFLPTGIARRLDQQSAGVREGMRITFKLLQEMNTTCLQSNIQFIVTVIPTKEMVFSEYLEHKPKLHLGDIIDRVIRNERIAREAMFKVFDESSICYVDTLPALKQAVGQELYARTATDMHPNKNGYRIIAEAVAQKLKTPKN